MQPRWIMVEEKVMIPGPLPPAWRPAHASAWCVGGARAHHAELVAILTAIRDVPVRTALLPMGLLSRIDAALAHAKSHSDAA